MLARRLGIPVWYDLQGAGNLVHAPRIYRTDNKNKGEVKVTSDPALAQLECCLRYLGPRGSFHDAIRYVDAMIEGWILREEVKR